MARANEKWLEVAGVPLPDRLSLRSVDASNLGDVAESRIREGYTQEERDSGVKMLDSVELLEQWEPSNPRSVALAMCLAIGWDDDIGTDDFRVYVVTKDLRSHLPLRSTAWVFVDVFEWQSVLASLLNILRKCEHATWDDSVQELRKRFDWEYEGMGGR
ncbi:Imm8 family immunity protein [Mesorhizobium sp. Mes31]|uniref:Imm8 family immunity protein n=1 Tax=Mesorhizobium sp. Mes31 TaxID=2926017 RepID=UPI002118397E|nr:Imm8 family immunity protein [Mesorhizobium sp. Mes31]